MSYQVESSQSNKISGSANKSQVSAYQQSSSPPSFFNDNISRKSFLGVTLKPGIPVTAFINYLLAFFLSVELLTLFSTSGYFLIKQNYHSSEQGPQKDQAALKDLTNITFYKQIFSIVMLPLTGILQDYIGRRIMLVSGTLICAIALFIIPIIRIIYPWLLLASFLLQQGIINLLTNPLAADYVVDEKKGLASAYVGIASGLGAILAALGLLGMGRQVGWGSVFYFSGALALVIGFYMFFFVVDVRPQKNGGKCPLITNQESGRSQDHLPSTLSYKIQKSIQSKDGQKRTCFVRVWDIIKTAFRQSWNSIIITSYIGSFAIRACDILMTTFLIYYVSSQEYDPKRAQADTHTMSGIGSVVGLFLAIIFGFLSDKIGFALTNIISYVFAGLCYGLVTYVNDNNVKNDKTKSLMILGAGFVTAGIVVMSNLQNNVMINRVLRKNAKGLIMGIFVFFGSCGVLFESKIGYHLIDEGYYGGPFPLGAGLCFFTALVTLIFWVGGCYGREVKRAAKIIQN